MEISYTLEDIVALLTPMEVIGHTTAIITKISPLASAEYGHITFLGNLKYQKEVADTQASIILMPPNCHTHPKHDQVFLTFRNPSHALGQLCKDIDVKRTPPRTAGIHPTASISEQATIGNNVYIGPHVVISDGVDIANDVTIMAGCYIGRMVKIGQGSICHPRVVVMDFCEIGSRVTLFSGVVIGSDGYGYETIDGQHEKIPQIGNVVIEDYVDVGANTTIDRARFGSTVVGQGTKIDNLVQIGHNVRIGKRCLIVAQAGISGSTTIGNDVVIGGQVGIAGHITIPDGVMIAGQSGVTSYKSHHGKILRGTPAEQINEINRFYVLRTKVPQLFKRVSEIEKILDQNKSTDPQSTDTEIRF